MLETTRYDLVIVGGTAAGISVAISSKRSGIPAVRLLEPTGSTVFPELAQENQLDIGYGESLVSIEADGDDLLITSNQRCYRSRGCLIAQREPDPEWTAPIPVPINGRVHIDTLPSDPTDQDVLIVGYSDHAIELLALAASQGARVVLAAGGIDPGKLSPAGESMLRRLERERSATVLYQSIPDEIEEANGFPVAVFNDRRTPDLEFDHIVFATTRRRPKAIRDVVSDEAIATGRVIFLGLPTEDPTVISAYGWNAGNVIAEACFPEIDVPPTPSPLTQLSRHSGAIDELRSTHYNATITHFEPTHSDLWVLRVRPDHGGTSYRPGQYASLGLGFWEQRVDDALDADLDERRTKLVRRSYSISHPIFDESGYLAIQSESDELEFYVALVAPTDSNIPALTPRLALKQPGDRIYLGPKVAGRYTLDAVTDPSSTVVFLATGTGEAPHNAMVTQLLHKGHYGPIISAVTVRRWVDLGYAEQHKKLHERYPNYRYVPLPTREADVPKRYLQDFIRDGDLAEAAGGTLDPATTHVYLCGNPAMIGLPETEDGVETYPTPTGVVELLTEQGFTLDHRKNPGNIHFEEYW